MQLGPVKELCQTRTCRLTWHLILGRRFWIEQLFSECNCYGVNKAFKTDHLGFWISEVELHPLLKFYGRRGFPFRITWKYELVRFLEDIFTSLRSKKYWLSWLVKSLLSDFHENNTFGRLIFWQACNKSIIFSIYIGKSWRSMILQVSDGHVWGSKSQRAIRCNGGCLEKSISG